LADLGQVINLEPLPVNAESVTDAYYLSSLPKHVLSHWCSIRAATYFLEEIVRMLLKTGEGDNEFGHVRDIGGLHAQPRIADGNAQTRLSDLPPARAAAMLASVSGRVFWVGGIEAAVRAL
jgi:hypothetical protein